VTTRTAAQVSREPHAAKTHRLQWIVDAYTLVFAGLLLVGGNLGDRIGRHRVLQAGLVLFAVTSVGAALSRTTGELIAGRAAMGVAAALIYPATLALLTSTFTVVRERATAIGIWSAISGLAVAIGPVSGGLLLRHFSWSSVFWVNVPVAAIAVAAVVGSVLASVYGTHVVRSMTSLGAPAAAAAAARQSVVAGLTLASRLPPAVAGIAAQAARQAFVDGLSAGSLVAAAGTGVAAAAAPAFLPARAGEPSAGSTADPVLIRTGEPGQVAAEDPRPAPAKPPGGSRSRGQAPR
jgi:MFS family permease